MIDSAKKGKVYLVGAGPGDPGLITVRGAELLKLADCIICDKLANPALLSLARQDAEVIHVPKRVGTTSFTQTEINELLVEKAGEGKIVVRLKGGDPCVFGRGSEELGVLAEAGIDFEIVPGVTAAIAAADYTGIMLTDRKYSSQVVLVTGREAEGKQKSNIDWQWLAKFEGTIVFYMGVGNLDFIAGKLMENGMSETMPAAVIADITLPSQRTVKAPLKLIAERCQQQAIEPPALIIVGTAASGDEKLNWFAKKPLFGKSIVVTRDDRGNADLAARIIREGGMPVEFPTIKIKPLTTGTEFLEALVKFTEYDWIVFTSINGVTVFFDALESLGKDARVLASAKVAVIGGETANKLLQFGIKPDFVPTVFTSRELGKQLIGFTNLQDKKLLLLRSDLASKELAELLLTAQAQVDEVAVYKIESAKTEGGWLEEKIRQKQIDWLTFASASSARIFFEQISPDLVKTSGVKVASIGPVTSELLEDLGIQIDVEAEEHTIEGLLEAIKRFY